VKIGETIACCLPVTESTPLKPEPISLEILYEDRHIIVINKPAPMVVHPAPGNDSGTLVNGLLYHCPELGGNLSERRPGIVHRLDKDTTGVMVVAKSRAALDDLSRQFKNRKVQKSYLALVHGIPEQESGIISLPIGRHPVHRKKMSTASPRGREAVTLWRIQHRYIASSLLAIELKTSRTHQIRVHCAALHHPILGDSVYGRGKYRQQKHTDPRLQALLQSPKRQMLHARHLCFTHPLKRRSMTFTAMIPEDMQVIMDGLAKISNEG